MVVIERGCFLLLVCEDFLIWWLKFFIDFVIGRFWLFCYNYEVVFLLGFLIIKIEKFKKVVGLIKICFVMLICCKLY